MAVIQTNFAQLAEHDEQLLRLGLLAERYFPEDPNTSLLKLRQLTELLAQHIATNVGAYVSVEESQYELIRRLQDQGILPREIAQLFGEIRRAGNAASHAMVGDHRTALAALKLTWQIGVWFHRTFKNPAFKSGPFVPPQAPRDEPDDLRAELARLAKALTEYRAVHREAAQRLESMEAKLREAQDEQSFWEQMAVEAEGAKAALEKRLATQQALAITQSKESIAAFVTAANAAATALHLDETETRKLIDHQLRQAGWEADSATLRYSAGARPEKGRNLAIAEWPTASGPADYVLFVGFTPMAAVEAKRNNTDVSGALQQAKRYSRGFTPMSSVWTTLCRKFSPRAPGPRRSVNGCRKSPPRPRPTLSSISPRLTIPTTSSSAKAAASPGSTAPSAVSSRRCSTPSTAPCGSSLRPDKDHHTP